MNVRFSRLSARLLVVCICVICFGALATAAGRMWMAAHLAGKRNPADWERATKIEPGNAAYWYQLGLYEEWDFEHGNVHEAILDFERGTRLNPRSYRLWAALASAYEASGQDQRARLAYQKAQAAFPVSAEMAWEFGSFLLRRGKPEQAAQEIRRALLNRPQLAASAVSQFWKAGVGIGTIFDDVLPARRKDYLSAFQYFVSQQDTDAALTSWGKVAGLGPKVPLHASLDFIGHLIDLHRVGDAERVWQQALHLAEMPGETQSGGSLVFNGGFERPLVNGGFGWRWIPAGGTGLDLVGDVTHGGSRSARVTFDGTANVDFRGLLQAVAVQPARQYSFSAYMRTDSISTDSGPRFVLRSCADPVQQFAKTPAMTGTHPWTKVQASFTAGAGVNCVEIVLRRVPSQMFDNKILGTAWVDDVRLVPVPGAGVPSR